MSGVLTEHTVRANASVFIVILLSVCLSISSTCFAESVSIRLEGHAIKIFNGIPKTLGWGQDLVYELAPPSIDARTMGALGGIPLVDVWNKNDGIAVFNTSAYQEPVTLKLESDKKGMTIEADGGTNLEVFRHTGDYFEAVREFALRIKKGLFRSAGTRLGLQCKLGTLWF